MIPLKVCVIGATNVGKSSLVSRFVHRSKVPECTHTIGIDVTITTLKMFEKVYRVKFFDLCGMIGYDSLYDQYLQNSVSIIVVYDITLYSSFVRAKKLVERIYSMHNEDFPVFLIGNKIDCIPQRRVSSDVALGHVKSMGNVFFCECSAKDATNTQEAIRMIIAESSRKVDNRIVEEYQPSTGSCVVV